MENLEQEAQLEKEPFSHFLHTLAEEHGAGKAPEDSFKRTCRCFTLSGPPALVPDDLIFHRVYIKEKLSRDISEGNGFPVEDHEIFYQEVIGKAACCTDLEPYFQNLSMTGHPKAIVWGAFHQDKDGKDPIAGLNAGQVKDILGLGRDWYPDGQPVVRVKYLPPAAVHRKIPTVADAGWNRYWVAAPAGTGHGLTWDLSQPRSTPGLGEVVRANGPWTWSVEPCIPDELPED